MGHESPATTTDVAPQGERFLSAAEVAKRMGVHPSTVYRLTYAGRLPTRRFGIGEKRPRGLRIPESAVNALLSSPEPLEMSA